MYKTHSLAMSPTDKQILIHMFIILPCHVSSCLKSQTMPPPQTLYKNKPHCHCITSNAFCCTISSGLTISSSETPDHGYYTSVSSLAHAMVQERLDQMINERKEARRLEKELRRKTRNDQGSKFIVMVAMEKVSADPRQDFRDSIIEMIKMNRIMQPRDLDKLLECYLSVNSDECRGVILDVFHKVCCDIFL